MSYRIIIDRSICDGYGACADIDPTDFTIGDDGLATAPRRRTRSRAGTRGRTPVPDGRDHGGRRVGGRDPMTAERGDVVIVGAGLAGARCAEALRTAGHPGRIVLLGEEPHAPYERPALSKDVLTGARDGPALRLRTQGFWDERRIELRPGCAVDELDLERRRVTADGDVVALRRTWCSPPACAPGAFRQSRTVPEFTRSAPSTTRSSSGASCGRGRALIVLGAGFVGLEVASSAIALGASVTVVDPAATPFLGPSGPRSATCSRAAPASRVSSYGSGAPWSPSSAARKADRVRSCSTTARAAPATSSSSASGRSRTPSWRTASSTWPTTAASPPMPPGAPRITGVYACGDVASRPYAGQADTLRLEHWGAAASSARAVASAITGMPLPADSPPFFWSDQFGWRLQAVGLPSGSLSVDLDDDLDGRHTWRATATTEAGSSGRWRSIDRTSSRRCAPS